jgi:hypothetical protein
VIQACTWSAWASTHFFAALSFEEDTHLFDCRIAHHSTNNVSLSAINWRLRWGTP